MKKLCKVFDICKNLWKDPAFRKIIIIFLCLKILIFSTGYLAYFLIPAETTSRKIITDNEFLNPWAQYDGKAYLDIAKNGYNNSFEGIGNYGWYPLYPLLIAIFGFIGYDLAAFLISNIFSFLAIVILYVLVKNEFGDKITKKTVFYMLLFPTAYFFSVMYAESLFLFLTLMTFFYARKDNWLMAGVFGFLTSLTRLQGILLFLPVIYLYLNKKDFNFRKIKSDIIFTFLIPLGLVIFVMFLYATTGDPLIQSKIFAAHGKEFSMPWETFNSEVAGLFQAVELKAVAYRMFNIFVSVTFFAMAILSFRFMKKDYVIYFLIASVLPLFSGNLEAIGRYNLTIFPAFVLLPILETKNRKFSVLIKILYIIFFVTLVLLTARHVNMHLDPYGL